jgi:hypothetical protein
MFFNVQENQQSNNKMSFFSTPVANLGFECPSLLQWNVVLFTQVFVVIFSHLKNRVSINIKTVFIIFYQYFRDMAEENIMGAKSIARRPPKVLNFV